MQVNPSEISFFLVKKTKAGALPMGQSWARGPHLFGSVPPLPLKGNQ